MIAVFDTSSFFNLVKYYLPLDKNGELKEIIKINYEAGEIKVIDQVIKECRWTAKGIVLEKLEFLKDTENHIKTTDLIPNTQFFNYINNEFCDHDIIKEKELTDEEVQLGKKQYLEGADCRLILYTQSILSQNPFIVTEESIHGNDGKVHRKIPYNCSFLSIKCCTLPEFLNAHFSLTISEVKPNNSSDLPIDTWDDIL